MWSRIHAELGVLPSELTHDMVAAAVAQRVRENVDLDWKQALPPADENKRKEFAKDVAAMANTRGDLIVFGVTEENEEATGFLPVANGEPERQRLRQIAARWIRPLVGGITMSPLEDKQGGRNLLIVSVPASPDAPHVWREKDEMGVPFRDGSDTHWMSEHQLERAYRDRFARRASDAVALEALIDHVHQQVDQSPDKGWLIVAARPTAPTPPYSTGPDRHEVSTVLEEALRIGVAIYPREPGSAVLDSLPHDAVNNPKTGLRRWVVRADPFAAPAAMTDSIQVELHHDGSSVFAVHVDGSWMSDSPTGLDGSTIVPVHLVERALVDAVAVAVAHSRHRGNTGILQVRAELRQPLDGPKAGFLGAVEIRRGAVGLVQGSRMIRRVIPVEVEVRADADVPALRAAVRQLAEDVLQQFGVQRVAIPD